MTSWLCGAVCDLQPWNAEGPGFNMDQVYLVGPLCRLYLMYAAAARNGKRSLSFPVL